MMAAALGFMLSLNSLSSYAQSETITTTTENTEEIVVKTKRPMAISAMVGTAGFGLEVKREVADKWVLRLGGNVLPFGFTKVETLGNVVVSGRYKGRFTNIHLLADYTFSPFNNFSMRGTAGLAYFAKGKVDATLTPVGSQKYGEIELNDGTMGDAVVTADWQGVAPYIGVGFGKAIPATRLNISVDLGTYYFVSNPDVDMVTSGYLMGNEAQKNQIKENLKSYSWLPTLQVALNYKF